MSFKIRKFKGRTPDVEKAGYIGDNAVLMGDVRLGKDVSIWPNCTLRADVGSIIIGEGTNIQDNSVIHVDHSDEYYSGGSREGHTFIGKGTVVGHACVVHACEIGDNCLVGMGAVVLDGAIMEDDSMLGANSTLTPGKVVKSGELWMGTPARFIRKLSPDDLEKNRLLAEEYLELSKLHGESR